MITQAQSIDPNLLAFQDSLRSVRAFVTGLSGSMTDQSWAGEDGTAYNTPYRYTAQGPNGVAVEGTAAQQAARSGINLPTAVLIGLAALAAYMVLK